MLEGARVLVTGGAGFIGVNLVRRLLAEGATVRATLRRRGPAVEAPDVEYITTDLERAEDCARAAAGMDYVVMCAANTAGAAVMTATPLAQVTPNAVMNTRMLEAAYEAGAKKFVFISSSAAYPPTGERPTREDEMFDGDPFDAYYAVGWMKRYAEILCRTYALKIAKPMQTAVVRPSNIYGPFDDFNFETSHVMAALIRRVADRQQPLQIWGTGEDVRDLIYIDDFIDGTIAVMTHDAPFVEVNIASGEAWTIKELLAAILEADGYADADVRFDTSKPRMPSVRRVDAAKAEREIGFKTRVPLKEGIRRTIEWYRAQPKVMGPDWLERRRRGVR